MGTLATGVAEHSDTAAAAAALEAGFGEIARLEAILSAWRADSELSRLNEASGGVFLCSADLYAVLDSALALARQTGGAFDPTVEPLIAAWDLRGAGRVPSQAELVSVGARVGFRRVVLDARARAAGLEPGTRVDLGGIGKGFALDHAAAVMRARGVMRALLNLGGEVRAWSDGAPWSVAVAHPADRLRPVVRLAVAGGAVSTSGQAERGFEAAGRHHGHVLDPVSGRPVPTRATVTVTASHATRTDALAKAFLVRGREGAERLARELPGVGVLWLEPDGEAVKAWCWNGLSATAEPGAAVRWMNPTRAPEVMQP